MAGPAYSAVPASFLDAYFLRVSREVYIVAMLQPATRMAAIARDLGHILAFGVTAMVAAKLGIAANTASTRHVPAFSFFRHIRYLLVLIIFRVHLYLRLLPSSGCP